MSLKVFPLLLSFGRIWEELVSTPLYMFGRIHQWSQLVPDFCLFGGFYLLMVAEMVKNPLAMWETLVQCLVWEGPPGGGQPTPVFWPGEFQGQRSLAGCSPWGRKELDRTERLTLSLSPQIVSGAPTPLLKAEQRALVFTWARDQLAAERILG